jgi:hypothetical protein
LCAEALSAQLTKAERIGLLKGVPTSPRGPRINHLFFADDSLLFCRAIPAEWHRLEGILELYERASGQMLNRDKTSIFFSRNTCNSVKENILRLAGVPTTQQYDKYLGLPALVGKSRIREFQSIKDRVRNKINEWKTKFMSQAGKEVLLKAVVQAIPTYSMSLFLLPKSLCKEINSIMQRFWWGHKENEKKIHWMSWEKLGRSKAQGGLGFRDLVCFNKALLAKQGWRIIQNPEGIVATVLKAKYFPHGTFLEAKEGNRPSLVWRSLLAANNLLKDGLIWRIGDGRSVKIWGDRWLPRPTSFQVQTPCQRLSPEATVSNLIDDSTASWNTSLVRDMFIADEAELICNLAINKYGQKDMLIWRGTPSGNFSVKSAYFMELNRKQRDDGEASTPSEEKEFWKDIWRLKVTNTTKNFLWRACSDIIPTKENLARKGVLEDDICEICGRESETVLHALWLCPSAQDVWGSCCLKIQKMQTMYRDLKEMLIDMLRRCDGEEAELFAVIAKGIWTKRNGVVFGKDFAHPKVIVNGAINNLKQFKLTKEYRDLEPPPVEIRDNEN